MHDDDGEWRMVFCFCLRTKTDDSSELKPRQGLGIAARLGASCCTCGNDASGQTRTLSPVRARTRTPAGCAVAADSLESSQYPQAKRLVPLQPTSGSLCEAGHTNAIAGHQASTEQGCTKVWLHLKQHHDAEILTAHKLLTNAS